MRSERAFSERAFKSYTPELHTKPYAGVTYEKRDYTPELHMKLYAGVTYEGLKIIRRSYIRKSRFSVFTFCEKVIRYP
jgi:hypothetical protein